MNVFIPTVYVFKLHPGLEKFANSLTDFYDYEYESLLLNRLLRYIEEIQ